MAQLLTGHSAQCVGCTESKQSLPAEIIVIKRSSYNYEIIVIKRSNA